MNPALECDFITLQSYYDAVIAGAHESKVLFCSPVN